MCPSTATVFALQQIQEFDLIQKFTCDSGLDPSSHWSKQVGVCIKHCDPGYERSAGLGTCQPCKPTEYNLDGHDCHICEQAAQCDYQEGVGYDILASPGFWRGQVSTC